MERSRTPWIARDLSKKMVLLSGPRQVGKTTLAKALVDHVEGAVYLNYDSFDDRAMIETRAWLPTTPRLVLDELHKMPGWKNYLKGLYDTKPSSLQILVTGSARLETFRHSGDSLAGRYFRHRLHPLSLAELHDPDDAALDRLLDRGGFPEPYLAETEDDARRWRLHYVDGLIRTDILDFEKVHDFRAMQTTLALLRRSVGSTLSYTSLARDVGCAPNTIRRYIEVLEALFIIFRVTPYHRNIARSILKAPKIYFYDTGMVLGDAGARFENLVAASLLKYLDTLEDLKGISTSLRTLRTKEKKEVDFLLVQDDTPTEMIEVKLSKASTSANLRYFHERYGITATQVVKTLRHERLDGAITLRRALPFLASLRVGAG